MSKIIAIELENFQSIEKRTRIELKPITLFFGPNSAGKSAVFDAFELLFLILDPQKFNNAEVLERLDRWTRRGTGPKRKMSLSLEFPFEFEEYFELWEKEGPKQTLAQERVHSGFYLDRDEVEQAGLDEKTIRIDLEFTVQDTNTRRCQANISHFSLSLNGSPLLTLSRNNPAKPTENPDDDEDGIPSYFDAELWLSLFDAFEILLGCEPCIVGLNSLTPLSLRPCTALTGFSHQEKAEASCDQARDLIFYFFAGFSMFHRDRSVVVSAHRSPPRPEDAAYVVDFNFKSKVSSSNSSPVGAISAVMEKQSGGADHLKGLSYFAYADLLLDCIEESYWFSPDVNESDAVMDVLKSNASKFCRVNHHLEKNLFTEKLYRLCCNASLMVPLDLNEVNPWTDSACYQPAAVRIFLKDGDGNSLDLADVGSGIPFVLPVIHAVVSGGFATIQQPELHLHPALQSSLADVFVEELNQDEFTGQFLIETHSEHFLLRLLRRIRDTEKAKTLSKELTLTNEDVAIYYFDPRVSEGTVVSRQLVTPLGDFYTDWPRGFFAERDGDLYDAP